MWTMTSPTQGSISFHVQSTLTNSTVVVMVSTVAMVAMVAVVVLVVVLVLVLVLVLVEVIEQHGGGDGLDTTWTMMVTMHDLDDDNDDAAH